MAVDEINKETDDKNLIKTEEKDTALSHDTSKEGNGKVTSGDDGASQISVEFDFPDGGWGWIVCIVSFWTNGTLFGVLNTFGLLLVSLVEEFGDKDDKTIVFKTSWIGALQIATTFSCSPIASTLTNRLGVRKTAFIGAVISTTGMVSSSFVGKLEVMYFTYGVMVGFGASLLYTPSMVILGHYFKKRLGLVNGIVSFGSAVATILLPFVIGSSIDAVGWRWTVRIQALFYAVLLPGCLVWKPLLPKPKQIKTSSQDDVDKKCGRGCFLRNLSICENKGYRVWAIALPVSFLGYFVPFVHLAKLIENRFPGEDPEILLMCIGITTGFSRLISGKVADIPSVNRIRMQQFSFVILGLSTACLAFANAFWQLIILTLIMGVCDGCFICLLGPIAFDLLGTAGAAQGLGCLLGLCSGPMTAGPPIAGLLYDTMGSYTVAFVLSGMPPLIGAVILFCVPYKIQIIPRMTEPEIHASQSMLNLHHAPPEEYQTPEGHRRVLVLTGTEDPTATPSLMHARLQELRLEGRHRTTSVPLLPTNDSSSKKTDDHKGPLQPAAHLFSSIPQYMNQV